MAFMGIRSTLRSIFQRGTGNQFTLQVWENWLDKLAGGWPSESGLPVTDSTALTWSVVWACVSVLAADVAKTPLSTFRRVTDGREEARDHYLWQRFRVSPNPYMTPFTYRQTMQKHLNIRGNAYSLIERNPAGEVTALWPRSPARMKPVVSGGRLSYIYTETTGQKTPYQPDQVFHLRGLSDDGIEGMSPVEIFREGIGLGIAYQRHQSQLFRNGARPPFFIETSPATGKETAQQIGEEFVKNYAGIANVGKTPVMFGGAKLTPIGFSNKDTEFIESQHFAVEQACRIWRVPPSKVMDFLRATFSNITEINIAYVGDSLMPHQVMWEQSIHQQLLREDERDTFYVEHDNSSMLKGTPKERMEVETGYVLNGVSQINEVRDSHNWNRVAGGDKNRVQMQMMPIDAPPGLAQPAAPPKPKEGG